MTPSDAAILLAMAATLDPRLSPPTPEDAQARAQAWAATLDPDLDLTEAKRMLITHYRETTSGVMPAHLNRLWRDYRRTMTAQQRENRELHARRQLEALAVPMPESVREQLRSILSREP